jgi:hypothetical protein
VDTEKAWNNDRRENYENEDFQNSLEKTKKNYAHPLYLKKTSVKNTKPCQHLQYSDLIYRPSASTVFI